MAANDQTVQPTVLSIWLRGLLLALLLVFVCGFNIFMNPLGVSVESDVINEELLTFLLMCVIGMMMAESTLVAVWMAFDNSAPGKRISIGLLLVLLICSTSAIGMFINEGRINGEVLSFPIQLALQLAIVFPALIGIRRWTRWRLEHAPEALNPLAATGQFSIRSTLIWTVEISLIAGMLSFLHRRLPPNEASSWASGDGLFVMTLVGVLLSLPAIAATWMFLGRGRVMLVGAVALLPALGITGGAAWGALILSGESDLSDALMQLVPLITGAIVASAFAYFILRALGYRMIRVQKAVTTTDATAAAVVIAPREFLSRYKLRWQLFLAMFMVLAACGSIGWRAVQVVPQQLKKAENLRLSDLGINVTHVTVTDSDGTRESIGLISIQPSTVVDESLLDEIKKIDPAPPLQLQNPKPREHLETLCKLTDARSLLVSESELTDADLLMVANSMTKLETLNISSTKVTSVGFAELAKLKNLQSLVVSNLPITDESLVHLHGLKSLLSLEIKSTNVTADGVQKLQEALPQVRIQRQ